MNLHLVKYIIRVVVCVTTHNRRLPVVRQAPLLQPRQPVVQPRQPVVQPRAPQLQLHLGRADAHPARTYTQ